MKMNKHTAISPAELADRLAIRELVEAYATRPKAVSREEVRRRALSQAATADETERVLERLAYLGFVQPDPAYRDKPGRPTSHWLVNPALAEP